MRTALPSVLHDISKTPYIRLLYNLILPIFVPKFQALLKLKLSYFLELYSIKSRADMLIRRRFLRLQKDRKMKPHFASWNSN